MLLFELSVFKLEVDLVDNNPFDSSLFFAVTLAVVLVFTNDFVLVFFPKFFPTDFSLTKDFSLPFAAEVVEVL
jgi:hypothetical protein